MAKNYRVSAGTRLINGLFRTMTRMGIGASYRHILTVRGRKTGRLHSTPVDVMNYGGRLWLVAPYGPTNWVRNARAAGEVTLARGGRHETYTVAEADQTEAVPVLRQYMTQVPVSRAYFDADSGSPDNLIVAELTRHPVLLLTTRVDTGRLQT
jgi:deazaflavin-dependent oxidoreductase (nitroreductase family)